MSQQIKSKPRPHPRKCREGVSPSAAGVMASPPADPLALIAKRDLAVLLAVNAWTIDRWRKMDPEFPQPLWLTGSTPRWRREDIDRWLEARQRGGVSPDWTKLHQRAASDA